MFFSCYWPAVKIILWLSFPHFFFSVCMSQAALSHAGLESNQGKNHQYETSRLPDSQPDRVTPLSMHEPSHSVCSNFPFILVLDRLSNHSFRGLQCIAQHLIIVIYWHCYAKNTIPFQRSMQPQSDSSRIRLKSMSWRYFHWSLLRLLWICIFSSTRLLF